MDCKGTHFFGITIYMHLFFRDFRAFCAFIDTYFLSFLKINKHLFIHNILICFFSAGCHTLPQTAATRLRQRPAQPEARCNRLIRKPIPTIRRHRPGQRRNTPSAPPPSAGQTRKPPVATARAALTQATDTKKRPGSQNPGPTNLSQAITWRNHNRKRPPASKPTFPAHGGSHSSAPRLPRRRPPTPRKAACAPRRSDGRGSRVRVSPPHRDTKLRKPPAAAPS